MAEGSTLHEENDSEDRLSLRFILNPGNAAFEPLQKMSRIQRYRMVKDILNKHFLMEKTGEAALLRQLLGSPALEERPAVKARTNRVKREPDEMGTTNHGQERSTPSPAPAPETQPEKHSVPKSPITLGHTNFM